MRLRVSSRLCRVPPFAVRRVLRDGSRNAAWRRRGHGVRALEHHDLVVAKQRYENHLEELVEQRTVELDKALNSLEGAYRSTLKALTAALETRDSETHGHSERVVTYSLRLG